MSIRNFDALFSPRSIALIGASNPPGSVGQVIAANLLGAGFEGPILCVNPHARAVASTHAYQSIAELPVTPDLAVIATPAASVPGIVAESASAAAGRPWLSVPASRTRAPEATCARKCWTRRART